MAYCAHCGTEIPDGAPVCTSCNQPTKKPRKYNPVLLGVLGGCGCLGLIVILGILSAIVVPNVLDATQKAKQKRTMADMRNVGTALMSWLTDQVGGAEAPEVTVPEYPSAEQLTEILVPLYIQKVPATDGWEHKLEYWINPNLLDSRVFRIRSPGRDGVFEADEYEQQPFPPTEYDRDLVWADGYWVQHPESGYSSPVP